jgi:hypothetical protein
MSWRLVKIQYPKDNNKIGALSRVSRTELLSYSS